MEPQLTLVYSGEEPPESYRKSLFLAGPTPREQRVASWRPEAIEILRTLGYDGVIYIPEWRNGDKPVDYIDQVEWEERCLNLADLIIFWVPRELETMPAFTTNVEFGAWQDSGKVIFGAPKEACKNDYLLHHAKKLRIKCHDDLTTTVETAIGTLGDGALRAHGEREVPLFVWNTPSFQNWYQAQKKAGNILNGAKVVWTFRVGPSRNILFFWALHVNVHITAENRDKVNEVVLSRPDISTIVMYRRQDPIRDSEVVLIREFRSPASTPDGYVWEVPGGSTFKANQDPVVLAAQECQEETGITIPADRIVKLEARQLNATLSAHQAHLFCVEITEEELRQLNESSGTAFGVEADSERTFVEVVRVGNILENTYVDWSMLGMILRVLAR